MLQENKARKIFRKMNISYPLISRKCLFFGKYGVICFLVTPILRFAFLSYYRRSIVWLYPEAYWRPCQISNTLPSIYVPSIINLRGANNINKDYPFNRTECQIEIGKYFQERSVKVKIFVSSKLLRNEWWPVSRIIISEVNDILADKCSLDGFYFIDQMHGWACILKIMSA